MEGSYGGGGEQQKSRASKFTVYQNPAISAALKTRSLRPTKSTFLFILSILSASALVLLTSGSEENEIFGSLISQYVSKELSFFSGLLIKAVRITAAVVLIGSLIAFVKAVLLWRVRDSEQVTVISPKGTKKQMYLSNRQLSFIGLKPKVEPQFESSKKPPKSATKPTSPTEALVPLHHPLTNSSRSSNKSTPSSKLHYFSSPSKSPSSASLYLAPASSSQSLYVQNSIGLDIFGNSPWSNKRATPHKEITSEEDLERFLADVDERISESASKLETPPPTIEGFGIMSPNTIATSANTSGTKRSIPLRPVRMSPGSQKFTTPPKKSFN